MKISKEELLRIEKQIRREEYIQERAYDGRLAPKIFIDRKKEQNRNHCRDKTKWLDT